MKRNELFLYLVKNSNIRSVTSLFLISISTLFIFAFSMADSNLEDMIPSKVRGIYTRLPNKYKKGIEEYYKTVIGDAYTGASSNNAGLAKHHIQTLKNDSCLNELAGLFYGEINLMDSMGLNERPRGRSLLPTGGRASLHTTTQSTKFLRPGWLWQLAIKYSGATSENGKLVGGDPNLAMKLIGICGHDDRYQLNSSGYSFSLKIPSKKFYVKTGSDLINTLGFDINPASYGYKSNKDYVENRAFLRIDNSLGGCPQMGSYMYYPGSLGEGVDLPQRVKNRIARVQAPNKGTKSLPAKYYHVLGSAYTTCILKKRNLMGIVSQNIQKAAAANYRSANLCSNIRSYEKKRNEIISEFSAIRSDKKNLVSFLSSSVQKVMKNPIICGFDEEGYQQSDDRDTFPKYCYIISKMGDQGRRDFWAKSLNKKNIEVRVRRYLGEMDAAYLYSKSNPGYHHNCRKTELFPEISRWLSVHRLSGVKNPCKKYLVGPRCHSARQVLGTWSIDFMWSAKQHELGAKFANKHCKPLKSESEPFGKTCEALRLIKESLPVEKDIEQGVSTVK